jgi:hypothetical protein
MHEDQPNAQAREELLRHLLASRQFAHSDNLKRILRYLVDRNLQDPAQPAPKEYEIAVAALGRPESFDSRMDPIVRVSLGSIRDRLFAFFNGEGRGSAWRMEIPKGHYELRYIRNAWTEKGEPAQRPVERFWSSYLEPTAPNIIVYTEPLFFRDDAGHYVRDWKVNSLEDVGNGVREFFPKDRRGQVEPVYHYLSAGEMHCLLSLTRMFHEAGVPVETRNSRNSQWSELCRSNLILLGSPRTNQFLQKLQAGLPLVTCEEKIEWRGPADSQRSYQGHRFLDGSLNRMTEYAVVTRRPGVLPGSTITMIAANHGRAIEGAAHTLTLDEALAEDLRRVECADDETLPECFQLLYRVETVDIDDEVTLVALEAAQAVERGGM